MPFISDQQLSRVQNFVHSQRAKAQRVKEKAEQKANEMKSTLECVGAASALGYLRGKREDASGVWNAPFVKFDMELLVGLTLVGSAFFEVAGKYSEDLLNMGNGVLAHYSGQVMRKMAKTGSFSQVAGARRARIGELPQYDPTSYNPSQMGSPYADPVAAALAQSGV